MTIIKSRFTFIIDSGDMDFKTWLNIVRKVGESVLFFEDELGVGFYRFCFAIHIIHVITSNATAIFAATGEGGLRQEAGSIESSRSN